MTSALGKNPPQTQPEALAALIFDVDGTLAETEELHRECFNAVFSRAGLKDHWRREQYGALLAVTGGKERMKFYFSSTSLQLSEATIAEFHAQKNTFYAARMAQQPPPLRPGVANLVFEAQNAGLSLGIATTTGQSNLEALMVPHFGTGWRQTFTTVVCGEDVEHKKPHPEAYQQALADLQLRPTQVIAIEDSEPGVASANAAGITVLATPSMYFESADFSAAALCLPDLERGIGDSDTPSLGIAQLADWFQRR